MTVKITSPALRYLIAGGLSLAIDYGLLLFFHRIIGWPLVASTTSAFVIGMIFNFFINKLWTFRGAKGTSETIQQSVLYVGLLILNLLFTNVFIYYLSTQSYGPELTKPFATLICSLFNYFAYKHIVFRRPAHDTKAHS